MLISRRGAKAQRVGEASPVQKNSGAWRQKLLSVSKKRLALLAVGLVIIITAVALVLVKASDESADKATYFMTEAQADTKKLEQLKSAAPPASAPVDKRAAYLSELGHASAAVGDYKGAVSAFDRRISVKTNDITYEDYLDIAGYYHKLNDPANAVRMLDKALEVLPRQDNPDELYYYRGEVTRIDNLRAEFSK